MVSNCYEIQWEINHYDTLRYHSTLAPHRCECKCASSCRTSGGNACRRTDTERGECRCGSAGAWTAWTIASSRDNETTTTTTTTSKLVNFNVQRVFFICYPSVALLKIRSLYTSVQKHRHFSYMSRVSSSRKPDLISQGRRPATLYVIQVQYLFFHAAGTEVHDVYSCVL